MKKIYSLAASMLLIILTTAPFSGKAQVDTSTVQKLLQYIMQPSSWRVSSPDVL